MKKILIAPIILSTTLFSAALPSNDALAVQPHEHAINAASKEWNVKANVPLFVKEKQAVKRLAVNSNDALNYLDQHKNKIVMKNPKASLKVKESKKDELGMTHIRFHQTKNGLPVEGSEIIVHYNQNNEITAVNGSYNEQVETSELNTSTLVTSEKAVEAAKASV
ncbi:hypothetical protein [Rossellomorea aquimaris]|uniref:Fungalysin/thermolysin propeptide n=1 Tax=Rossellomorea aquimaris TaxID=189382 RepID=A0A366ELX0_9BACI|nr:hypothetical protein [Rossellomorea aquimaris]RBP02730.1 fungalysin/thermolysin propeptide [Rossellomorea aquimaris]